MTFLRTFYTMRWLLVLLVCAVAGCKRFGEPEWEQTTPDRATISILDLHRTLGEQSIDIEQDMVIGGYVTSSDRASNFYRSFTIEDNSGGVEIMAGLYDLHNLYPEGYYVSVQLRGCSVGTSRGVMQVGMAAKEYSEYATDYFASKVMLDKHIKRYNIRQQIAPMPLTLAELERELCGRLVHIEAVQCDEGGVWSGYRLFHDSEGRGVMVYSSEYADYAQQPTPTGVVSLTGILQYGDVQGQEYYIIKMRDEEDCHSTF